MAHRESAKEWLASAGIAAAVVVGALAVLGLAGGPGARHAAGPRKSGSSPFGGVRPPAARPSGWLDVAQVSGSGAFQDAVSQISRWSADGQQAVVLVHRSGCCLAWSSGRRVFALRLGAGRSARLAIVSSTRPRTQVLLPAVASRMRFIPGAWSPTDHELALTGIDPRNRARDGLYTLRIPAGLTRFVRSGGGVANAVVAPPQLIARMDPAQPELPLAYSPDGRSLLVFRRSIAGRFGRLYVRTPHGAMAAVGTQSVLCCLFGSPASWSPDGRNIAYAGFTDRGGGDPASSAVFVADANGAHAHRITAPGEWTTSARWSPRGGWIAFDRLSRSTAHDEFLVRPDGSTTRLIDTQGQDGGGSCCAQWSPDGRYLAYEHTSGITGDIALDVIAVHGRSAPTAVTGAARGFIAFAWVR